jgi:hypothetical protein
VQPGRLRPAQVGGHVPGRLLELVAEGHRGTNRRRVAHVDAGPCVVRRVAGELDRGCAQPGECTLDPGRQRPPDAAPPLFRVDRQQVDVAGGRITGGHRAEHDADHPPARHQRGEAGQPPRLRGPAVRTGAFPQAPDDLRSLGGVLGQIQRGTAERHHSGRVVVGQLGDLTVHDRRTYRAYFPAGGTAARANVGRVRDPSVSRYAAGRLSPIRRVADLRRLRNEQFDVLVIGGGVTGAGAALDAASRGLSVALVEARDLAAGTSSRSSKLIHGGLRYLEQLELHLVHEALTERGLLSTRIAPHLVRPVPILVPLLAGGPASRSWHRAYYGAGVAAYDVFAGLFGSGRGMPLHRHLTRNGARHLFPSLRADKIAGADPVLRRAGRRRPPGRQSGPYGGQPRCGRRHQRPGHRLRAGGA